VTWFEDYAVRQGLKLHADLARMSDKLHSDLSRARRDREVHFARDVFPRTLDRRLRFSSFERGRRL
jgi:hypothetical protein